MDLSLLGEDTDLNEHEIAWVEKDWAKVKELSAQFKKDADQSLWDILNNITQKTGYKSAAHFETYDQRAVNNALSQHISMAGYATELNQMEGLITDQMHYDYAYHTIRKAKLPKVKFAKNHDDWTDKIIIKMVAKSYDVSMARAKEYVEDILSGEQLEYIKTLMAPTVDSADHPILSVIPTKAERTKVFNEIRSW